MFPIFQNSYGERQNHKENKYSVSAYMRSCTDHFNRCTDRCLNLLSFVVNLLKQMS